MSVLVTNFNYARFLREALDSVGRQTHANVEVIVCDDASTDESVTIVESFARRDDRFSLVRHRQTLGQAAAFNSAFAQARGDVICFLDSDDMFAPGKVDAIVWALRRRSVGAVVHRLTMIDERGPVQQIPTFTRFESGWIAPQVVARGGRWRWMPTSAVAMHRDIADAVFPMPEEGYTSSADTYFLMLMPLLTPIASLDDVLGIYRKHGANAYARSRLDPERIAGFIENLKLSVDQVNARLLMVGDRDVRLDIEDNLRYREAALQLELLASGTPRRGVAAAFARFVPVVLRDDLYGAMQKAWAVFMYGVAIALPRSARRSWLSASLSASRAKEAVRRILGPRGSKG